MFKKTKKLKKDSKSLKFLQRLDDEKFQMILVEPEQHFTKVNDNVQLSKPQVGFKPMLTSTPKKCQTHNKTDEDDVKKSNRVTLSQFVNELHNSNEVDIEQTIHNDFPVELPNFAIPRSKRTLFETTNNNLTFNELDKNDNLESFLNVTRGNELKNKAKENFKSFLDVTVENELKSDNLRGFEKLLQKLSQKLPMKKSRAPFNESTQNIFGDIFKTTFKEDPWDEIIDLADSENSWDSDFVDSIKDKSIHQFSRKREPKLIQNDKIKKRMKSYYSKCFEDFDEATLGSHDWEILCRLFLKSNA